MDKENVVHLYNGVLHSSKKTMKFAGKWTDLEKTILTEVTQKDKYNMHSLINGFYT